MELSKTQRDFSITNFEDYNGFMCSLQKSSLATENCIWFGINETKLTVFADKSKGAYIETDMPENFSVNTRMHLTQVRVKELLPFLQRFAETGDLESEFTPNVNEVYSPDALGLCRNCGENHFKHKERGFVCNEA